MSRTVTVYETLIDVPASGPAGDGTRVFRSRDREYIAALAALSTCWGRPAEWSRVDVRPVLAQRWGLA